MSDWISVDDRLPKVGESVITVGVDNDGCFLSPVCAALRDNSKFIVGYSFHGDREIGFYIETFPTHWMPLPEPPTCGDSK